MDEHEDQIQLSRGGRKITLTKRPEYFAVKLKQGRAASSSALEACCGPSPSPVRHVDTVSTGDMELFAVEETEEMEATVDALRSASGSEVVTHVYSVDDSPQGVMIPVGTLTLQFRPDVNVAARESLLSEFGLEVVEELGFMPHAFVVQLTDASTENPLKIAAKLQLRDELLVAEPDLSFRAALQHVPTDPLYAEQWHLTNRGGQVGMVAGADVKAEAAWDMTTGAREIVVAVIDDGFDLEHPDLGAPGKLVAPRDFGQNDADPNPATNDDNHGTACAGVAVAEENGLGVVGLAPACSLMPIRMATWLTDSSVRAMFQYAMDRGADVISCSWTAGAQDFPLSTQMNAILHHVATQGRGNGRGCVILFAAGNDNRPLDGMHNGQPSVQGFGIHPDVICVGASNSLDKRSSYSNFGPELTLCAPSSGSPGRRIVTTDRRGAQGYAGEDYTTTFGGTSSATPLAAGLAALILSVNPELTSTEVRQIMMDTADKIDEAGGAYQGGHSPWYGHGRINAEAAVARAAGLDEEPLPRVLALDHRINLPIPDLGETEDVIPFPLDVAIRELEISVEIMHTWRGDLRVRLVPPGGIAEVLLWASTGGSQDDLVQTFRASAEPALLGHLLGAKALGDWRLQVADNAQQDVGVLNHWGIAVTY